MNVQEESGVGEREEESGIGGRVSGIGEREAKRRRFDLGTTTGDINVQKPLLNVGIAMLCLAFSDASVRAEAEHTSLARWAVVSSLELQRGGIPDLVTAKLAGVDGLQLVERDRILEATRELTISRMAGAEGTKARLSLGRTVGADVLLLLIDQPIESKPGLLVVISDCRLGARLRSEHLMLPTDDAQPVVARIGELVDWTRRQFAGGIQFVVGVSPFVSQTLVHDWDYLQFSMARVLEGALASRPGVAAIEIEEARAIRSERDLTAGTGSDRLVPLLVEGTYRITPSHNGGEPTMSIQVKLEDGRKVLHTLDKDGLALSAAAEYVRTEAQKWSALAGGSGLGRRIGRDEQIAFMTQQAASFANLGAYDQSTALREACLLLSPELIDQRTALVREYSALIRTKPPWAIEARPMEAAEAAAFLERFVQHWGLFFQHADLLIRGPNGPPKQIPGICRELVSSMEHFWAVMDDQGMAIDAGLRQDCLNRISELKTRFIRTSLPLLLSRMNEQEWQDLVVRYATCSFVPRSLDWSLRDTHALVTLLLEAIPPAQPVYGNLAEWFVDKTNYWKCDEISCETQETDAMREVCRQLIASRQHRTVLLGRLIQLCLDRRIQKAKSDGILAASRDLEAEAREWGHPGVAQIAGGVRRDILVARGTPEPPPSNISYWAPDPPADFIPKTPVHLRAERIEMSVKDATGTIHPAEGVERWARGGGRTTSVRCDGSGIAGGPGRAWWPSPRLGGS